MKYRDQNIFTFIFSQGISALTWIMFGFGILMAIGVGAMEIKQNQFPKFSLIVLVLIFCVYLLLSAFNYFVYKRGKYLATEIDKEILEIFENLKVNVRNFDMFELQKKFPPNMSITIYDFDICDVIITKNSLILMGYGIQGLMKGYANPVEILFYGNPKIPNYAKLVDNPIIGVSKIELKIDDKNYKNHLKIEIESNEKIRQRLTAVMAPAL